MCYKKLQFILFLRIMTIFVDDKFPLGGYIRTKIVL